MEDERLAAESPVDAVAWFSDALDGVRLRLGVGRSRHELGQQFLEPRLTPRQGKRQDDSQAPRYAEPATKSLEEAREILALMDELEYSWIEGPLPPVPFETQIPKHAELVRTADKKQRTQAEGPGAPIGDGTSFAVMKQWVEAGAVNQCSTDACISTGVTNALRMLEDAKSHPPPVINLHRAWAPHARLAMAYDDNVMPCVEFPMSENVPKEHLAGPWLLAPVWPGIYRLDEGAAASV